MKNKCKLTKNLTYIAISFASIVILSIVLFDMTRANPDYICIKTVYDQSCILEGGGGCQPWGTDGVRYCSGKKATKVGYYNARVSCEAGYDIISNGTFDGASGRHGGMADIVMESEDCTIKQEDHVAPVGNGTVTTNN